MSSIAKTLAAGGRLPDVQLPAAGGGKPVELRRRGRRATVVIAMHGTGCPACGAYVRELGDRATALIEWDGRVVMVATDPPDFEIPPEFELSIMPEAEIRDRLCVDVPTLVIADQWGEVFAVESGGPGHGWLEASEVVEWLRYLAIQCPECQGEAY